MTRSDDICYKVVLIQDPSFGNVLDGLLHRLLERPDTIKTLGVFFTIFINIAFSWDIIAMPCSPKISLISHLHSRAKNMSSPSSISLKTRLLLKPFSVGFFWVRFWRNLYWLKYIHFALLTFIKTVFWQLICKTWH